VCDHRLRCGWLSFLRCRYLRHRSPDAAEVRERRCRWPRVASPSSRASRIRSAMGEAFVRAHSVTRRCAPNLDFGRHGVATVGISSRSPRTRPAGGAPSGLRIRAVAAWNGGGAILAGGFGSNWVVGEVNRSGQIDRTFGNGGWEVLPFHGEATAIVQEPSGRIVIGVPRRPRHGRRQVAVCRPNTTDVDGAPPRRLDRSSLRQPRPRADSHALAGGPYAALDTTVLINQASPNTVVLVAWSYGRNQLQVIRVRI
jgi:hypothetical protein